MKRFAMNSLFFAAALTAASVGASAQSLKAEIPFPFESAGKAMPAGTYTVDMGMGGSQANLIRLSQWDTKTAVLVVPQVRLGLKAGDPAENKLTFQCTEGHCVLRSVSDFVLAAPKYGHIDNPETRMIALTRVSAR